MEDKLNNFPEGTKRKDVIEELIDHDDIREVVLKQFNYMRINGINLVQDADNLVNLYLKIAKKFPEQLKKNVSKYTTFTIFLI